MRKKTIFILLLLFLATFGFSACTALYEDRDKIVEDEMDKYNVQIAAYDRLEKNFDYTDSVRAVESRNGHNRGTRFSSNDDPDNTLFHLNDLDESTVYQSSAYADAAQKVIVTADMQKSKFIDRIQISPAKDKDGGTTGFPKSFYIELSNDMSNWTIVAARSDYPVPAETAVFRIAAQSARYIRLVATELGAAEHKFSLCLSEMDAYFDDYYNQGYERARAVKYYVSSSSGDDANDGLSPETAWKTLNRANRMQFVAGSELLLKRGDTWTGESLQPVGDGTKENPILISSYGEGDLPVINAGLGAGYGIKIYNNDYYKIADVAFAHSVAGIYVVSDLRNIDMQTYRFDALKGIYVQNCVFTDIQAPEVTSQSGLIKYPDMSFGAGIHFTAYGFNLVKGGQKYGTWGTRADGKNIQSPYAGEGDTLNTYIEDIRISDCEFTRCDTGIDNALVDLGDVSKGLHAQAGFFNQTNANSGHLDVFHTRSLSAVTVKNVKIADSIRSGGIMLYGAYDGLIDNAVITGTGVKGMYWGVAACQLSMCEEFVVQNSEFSGTLLNGGPDGEGFDFESGNINVTLKDSYIHDNEGPAILFYGGNNGWGGVNRGCVVDNVVMENNGIFSKETLTGKGLYNDHSKAIKDYPTPNIVAGGDGNVYVQANFGVIRNSKFVESYDGQGFLTGYEVAGDKSMMNGHKVGTYDAARDVTYYGIVMDMDSNRIYAPDGTTLKAGKDADPSANGVESYGKEWQIGKMDGGNFVKSDELVSESGGNSAKYLADGELSAMYDYHRGFSTIDLASSSVDLAFQVDLGAVTTLTAVRMYGVQNLSFDASVWNNAEYGYLLPKSFTVYTSEDGETWTQRKIRALSSEGGYVRGGVDKIIDFKPTTARATNDFVFADIEVNARYVRIIVDGANAVAGTSGVWRVEIGELQVISSFDTNVDYVYPDTGRKGD